MSRQLDRVFADLDKAMAGLRTAVKGIPVRREKLKPLHDEFARGVAALLTDVSYSRSQLPDS
ncbi:hypothetical protein [Crossiella sp. CA198]|uniref:hypothetical protein n=1 Tax=Crossiella sp. CA198 TaxID=3455607 RepID=UPI003F8D2153